MSMQAIAGAIPHSEVHEAHHEEAGFWRTYVFSTDHKVIGIQYGITALLFLLFGFSLMMVMRWQIAHPGVPVPIVGPLLAAAFGDIAAKGIVGPGFTIPLARCTGPSWSFWASCRWPLPPSA